MLSCVSSCRRVLVNVLIFFRCWARIPRLTTPIMFYPASGSYCISSNYLSLTNL
nr:MAG TPA: hypothetical protein [Bacteriophage sp.]